MEGDDWKRAAARDYNLRREALLAEHAELDGLMQRTETRMGEIEDEVIQLDTAAAVFGIDTETEQPAPKRETETSVALVPTASNNEPSARDIIEAELKAAGPGGRKAKELRKLIEAKLGRKIHYKTPGMTLYRLGLEDKVVRDGHFWFWKEPDLETRMQEATVMDTE